MIREIFTYLNEKPKLSVAKKFGHLTESISLVEREKRCHEFWQPHRIHCKKFISKYCCYASHFESLLILGSGPLHEIPIEELSAKFKNITLVDIVHLRQTKQKYQHLSNLHFVEHDISEIEFDISRKILANKKPQTFLDQNWGLVMSVNVMSQLPIHINHYIEKFYKKKYDLTKIDSFLKQITKDHYEYLISFNSPVLIISDTEVIYYNKNQRTIEHDRNFLHLNLPKSIESWFWNIAPIPEFQKDIGMKMKVEAFYIKNK